MQNKSGLRTEQTGRLEQQKDDKRSKIIKSEECIEKEHTLSTTITPISLSITSSSITSPTDDEQQINKDEETITTEKTTTITNKLFLNVQLNRFQCQVHVLFKVYQLSEMLHHYHPQGNEQPVSATVNNLVMYVCFTSLPSKFNVAVELFTRFLASSPNQVRISLSSQTPIPISSILSPSPSASATSPSQISTTSLLEQFTRKEYGQAKKSNNHFNIPLGTKFYRFRVKPWKPITSSSSNRFISIFYLSNHSVLFV